MARFLAFVALLCATPVLAASLPDPRLTPGAVDPVVTLSRICTDTTKTRRRALTRKCDAVFRAYGIPDTPRARYSFECDHLVPLALGGSNAAANLWPQTNLDAARKDRLEVEMQRRACVAYRTLLPAEAAEVLAQEQREIATDWRAAYRKYVGPAPE